MAEKKRRQVQIEPVDGKHEAHAMMTALIDAHHPHLRQADIGLYWYKSWRADGDGVQVVSSARKSSDLTKCQAKKNTGRDFCVLLNHDLWFSGTIPEGMREFMLDNALCRCAADKDRDGEQKRDDEDRLCWRLRKPPIQVFPEAVGRWGAVTESLARMLHEAEVRSGVNQPLFDFFGMGREEPHPETNAVPAEDPEYVEYDPPDDDEEDDGGVDDVPLPAETANVTDMATGERITPGEMMDRIQTNFAKEETTT